MSFDQNSKFDPSKNYGVVKFGARKPVLEIELNELQEIQNHARAEIIRKSIYSGVLNLGAITTLPTTPNTFRVAKQEVNVNGYLIDLPQTDIILPEPPTEGERDDLVFLEAWFEEVDSIKDPAIKDSRIGEETSRRIKLNWRIRTVAGVDFEKYPNGFCKEGTWNGWLDSVNFTVSAQGGNETPMEVEADLVNKHYVFLSADYRKVNNRISDSDIGLYVAGDGSQTSKDLLKTVDGYVYAIPFFRVKRRNSGGYSVENGNGARLIETGYFNSAPPPGINIGKTIQVNSPKYDSVNVGDIFYHPQSFPGFKVEVVSKDGNGLVTLKHIGTLNGLVSLQLMFKASDRPDGLFANIIDEDDIIDLRHSVSLTGWNYDKLLEENFDKLLRGELRTKEGQKMLKTYHGIRKTPIDSNHVFYASFDGTVTPEVGNFNSTIQGTFYPTWTGLGIQLARGKSYKFEPLGPATLSEGTIDCVITGFDKLTPQWDTSDIVIRNDALQLLVNHNRITIGVRYSYRYVYLDKPIMGVHVRITWNSTSVKLYVNGTLRHTYTLSTPLVVDLRELNFSNSSYDFTGIISDLAISNIDRGENFATLPKDFIDGYARIMPAFNTQRRILSDAQTAQKTVAIAKPFSHASDREITVIKGTGTNETIWEEGDKIKVKGLAGEIIDDVSAPTVKTSLDGGKTTIDVVGTWTGLGTSEATFTLGANTDLDTEDIVINYNLLIDGGQGGIPEVLTETLAGEWNGIKLVKGTAVSKADFRGKVSGSFVENPHKAGRTSSNTGVSQLLNPLGQYPELTNGLYAIISSLNDDVMDSFTSAEGGIPQHLFTFNIVRHFEERYGIDFFKGCLTFEDKLQRVIDKTHRIGISWTGYGIHPNGYKASLVDYFNGDWSINPSSHTNDTPTTITKYTNSEISSALDSDGNVYFLAYAEPADGESQSRIVTKHVELLVELKDREGYDTLAPKDPFAKNGGILYIHKETKEIETLMDTNENGGVVTYGNYVPYQGLGDISENWSLADKLVATTIGTGRGHYNSLYKAVTTHLPTALPDHNFTVDTISDENQPSIIGYLVGDLSIVSGRYEDSGGQQYRGSSIIRPYIKRYDTANKRFHLDNYHRGFGRGGISTDEILYINKRLISSGNILTIYANIVEKNNKLYMGILTWHGNHSPWVNNAIDLYEIEGRPLVKEVY